MAGKTTIWIIDDSPSLGRTFALALEAAGYAAESLEDLPAAEKRAGSAKPDLLVVDNNGNDGWVAAVAGSSLAGIPVVALLGATEPESGLPNGGVAARARKPLETSELLDAVREALGDAPRGRRKRAVVKPGEDKPAKRFGCGATALALIALLVLGHATYQTAQLVGHVFGAQMNRVAVAGK